MKTAVRGLVAATFVSAVLACITSNHDPTSVLVFTVALMVPGMFILIWPERAPLLGLWGTWSTFCALALLTSRGPMALLPERIALACALSLSVVGSIVMAFAVAGHAKPAIVDYTPRVRRIQGVAQLSAIVAAVSIVATWIVIGVAHWEGATALSVTILAVVAPGSLVYRAPVRVTSVLWTCWSLPVAAIYLIVHDAAKNDIGAELGPRVLLGCYGTLAAMIAVVLPLVAFLSSGEPGRDLPAARVH